MQISITKNPNPGKMPPENELGFGRIFTDHMLIMDYTDEKKWHNARILPYGPISLMPSGDGIQYANTVFEGMKAYRWADGSVIFSDRLRTQNESTFQPKESVSLKSRTKCSLRQSENS